MTYQFTSFYTITETVTKKAKKENPSMKKKFLGASAICITADCRNIHILRNSLMQAKSGHNGPTDDVLTDFQAWVKNKTLKSHEQQSP